ncbi:MAG TPA: metallophosphoesterase family protein [Planctomycetota bacterium]|nr:metallophosphoesterase family protein [Planctomycetota bacterium]
MHRRAVISDIHANLPALDAVLSDIAAQQVDDIVCLGDICGYGPQPVECIARVRGVAKWTLLGNHDEAVFKEPIDFSRNAYDAIVWQRTVLDPAKLSSPGPADVERWEWLKSLEPSRTDKSVRYVHASPRDPIHEYVLKEDFDESCGGPTDAGRKQLEAIDWLCFCGHSHRPGVVAEDYRWWLPEELPEGRCMLRPGFKTIVNVGSVGQPRDGHPEACYAIFEYDPNKDLGASQSGIRPSAASLIAGARDPSTTMVLTRPDLLPIGNDEETRGEKDRELQEARKTVILLTPKVHFRRVPYDIHAAQTRFFAIPDLPRYNGIRLMTGK